MHFERLGAVLLVGQGFGRLLGVLCPLRSDSLKSALGAPDGAAYQVWSIDRDSLTGISHSRSLFYDPTLKLLASVENPQETYDPRTRPWYNKALLSQEHHTTAPYAFFSTSEVGTTISRQSTGTTVVGADFVFDDGSILLFLARKLFVFVEYLSFWR